MKTVVTLTSAILSATILSFAQTTQTSKPSETSQLRLRAPGKGVRDSKRRTIIWTGTKNQQVSVEEEGQNYKLLADRIEYFEDNDTAEISGNLKFTNPDTTVTATAASADFGESKIVFKGDVNLVSRQHESKGKNGKNASKSGETSSKAEGKGASAEPSKSNGKSPAPAKSKHTVLTCEQFEFDYETRLGTATGKLKIVQQERTATAEKAIFEEQKNIITLEGNVEMDEQENNRRAKVARIVINVDEDSWTAENAEAKLMVKRKKGKAQASGKSKGPQPNGVEVKPANQPAAVTPN